MPKAINSPRSRAAAGPALLLPLVAPVKKPPVRARVRALPRPQARTMSLPFLAEDEMLRTGVRRLSAAWRDYQPAGQGDRRRNVGMV